MAPPLTTPKSDAEFAEQFASKLEMTDSGEGSASSKSTSATDDEASSGASDDAEHDESDGSRAADDDAENDGDDDTGDEGDEGKSDDEGTSQDEAESDEQEEGDKEGEADDESDDADDKGEDDAQADGDKGLAAEVKAKLAKAGLNITLKDIPAEARPLVQKKLDHAQAAVTRALQDATAFRKEKQQFQAEQRFRDEHPEMAIAEILDAKPELIEKVQEHIDKLADPDKKRLFANDVKEARSKALNAIQQAEAQHERVMQRADEMESYIRRASQRLDIPASVVEKAVALELMNKPDNARDLTAQELDAIITQEAKAFRSVNRQRTLRQQKETIRERTRDKKTSTPAVRAGSGAPAATPGGRRAPKTDAEFVNLMMNKLK